MTRPNNDADPRRYSSVRGIGPMMRLPFEDDYMIYHIIVKSDDYESQEFIKSTDDDDNELEEIGIEEMMKHSGVDITNKEDDDPYIGEIEGIPKIDELYPWIWTPSFDKDGCIIDDYQPIPYNFMQLQFIMSNIFSRENIPRYWNIDPVSQEPEESHEDE